MYRDNQDHDALRFTIHGKVSVSPPNAIAVLRVAHAEDIERFFGVPCAEVDDASVLGWSLLRRPAGFGEGWWCATVFTTLLTKALSNFTRLHILPDHVRAWTPVERQACLRWMSDTREELPPHVRRLVAAQHEDQQKFMSEDPSESWCSEIMESLLAFAIEATANGIQAPADDVVRIVRGWDAADRASAARWLGAVRSGGPAPAHLAQVFASFGGGGPRGHALALPSARGVHVERLFELAQHALPGQIAFVLVEDDAKLEVLRADLEGAGLIQPNAPEGRLRATVDNSDELYAWYASALRRNEDRTAWPVTFLCAAEPSPEHAVGARVQAWRAVFHRIGEEHQDIARCVRGLIIIAIRPWHLAALRCSLLWARRSLAILLDDENSVSDELDPHEPEMMARSLDMADVPPAVGVALDTIPAARDVG